MVFRLVGFAAVALMASGCVTPTEISKPISQNISEPPIGSTRTVSIGDALLKQGTLQKRRGIEIKGPVSVSLYTLHGGFYPQYATGPDGTFHQFVLGPVSSERVGGLTKSLIADPPKAILAKGNGRLCVVTVFNVAGCSGGIAYSATERMVASADSFQQTLLYSGRVGPKIKISYREFSSNRARPAFNNDVEYDLRSSRTFSYKGARIEVIKADNNGITYKVLSNFR